MGMGMGMGMVVISQVEQVRPYNFRFCGGLSFFVVAVSCATFLYIFFFVTRLVKFGGGVRSCSSNWNSL